ncbi:minor capsid protein [Corallococcus exiguus]|uniref:minor capsid protein n=1 Tax=Corallococcus exiguus TaxID=83462 RepID=UPI003D28356E
MPEEEGDVPDRAVALVVSGGARPQPYLGLRRAAYFVTSCQVRVRSAREDFGGGQLLANAVFAVLEQACVTPGVSRSEEGAPVYFGSDGSDRYIWSMNFTVGNRWMPGVR